MPVDSVIPGRSNVSPAAGLGRREKPHALEVQVIHNVPPAKRLIVALSEVGDGVGGVWLVVNTLHVQVRWVYITFVPIEI